MNYYLPGAHNVICDRCGAKIKSTVARKTWDNLIVCPADWEPRHPQDLIRLHKEDPSVRDPRPRQTDYFLSSNEVLATDL